MKTFEQFSPIPSRSQVAETIRNSGFESQDAQIMYEKYIMDLRNHAEKNPDGGRANIAVHIEAAKLYYEAGMKQTAYDLLTEDYVGMLYVARQEGFQDMYHEIEGILDGWEGELA